MCNGQVALDTGDIATSTPYIHNHIWIYLRLCCRWVCAYCYILSVHGTTDRGNPLLHPHFWYTRVISAVGGCLGRKTSFRSLRGF